MPPALTGVIPNRRVAPVRNLLFSRDPSQPLKSPLPAPSYNRNSMPRTVRAVCPHDCPDACGVLITINNDRATKIQGDPDHPVTRGFLCAKVAKYLDRVYSPDRVLYPMRRIAPKGPGATNAWQRISWDEALDTIAARFRSIIADQGSEAILPYSFGGTLGTLNGSTMDRRFFHRLGASQLDRTICSAAGEAGLESVLGAKIGTEPEQFRHAKYIIAWAANIHGTNVHLWPFIAEARRNGAKLVVIDPYRTRTAACADWYLPINPGTDAALALAMMHIIIGENLHDADYVSKYTIGFDQLREKVKEYPPERVAQWTDISADDIRTLAREYATTHPAVIRLNYGVQRSERGGMSTRAITMLPCITGSWKELGGGFQLSTSGAVELNSKALRRPDLMRTALGRDARTINMVELGRALNTLDDPPVKALFVYNSNPAAVCPQHNEVIRGLKRPDLFTVVHEQFFTDTTDYADILLPATTFFEHKDLQKAYGHYYFQVSNQAIEPLGECRSNVEVFRALAERMNFSEDCFRQSVDDMIDLALDVKNPLLEGLTRERLEQGPTRLNFERKEEEGLNRPDRVPHFSRAVGARSGDFQQDEPQASLPSAKEEETTQEKADSTPDRVPHFSRGVGARSGDFQPDEPQPYLPFAQGNFRTPSGKALLYNESLIAEGLDPVASFTPPTESRHGTKQKSFPLELLARKADNFLNSTFSNLAAIQEMEQSGLLEICADDAQARGITTGDTVRVFNHRGEILLKAHVDGKVQPGVVSAFLNWAKTAPNFQSVNSLISEKLTDMGRSATFYSTLVEVERAK